METTQIQPKKQRVAAIAVIFAVLFQLYLASTAALNPTQVHNKSWLNKVQNEKVLLCTAEGFKWVDINTLIAANAQPSSEFIDNLKLHDGFQFECPLLQAVQFFLLVAVGLYLATIQWLRRVKHALTPYHFAQCGRLVYQHIAPKQSPPCVFPA
ncbi:hypothetical protein ABLB37_11435 [Vibrio parahaemolyticus]|uniref:Uncharacterized protein n=3 Tax=Vibrio TaxID=662 RepID=A0A0M2INR0_VIBPH|nr:hypothetical protein [Vibrio parahaemolyticus]EFO44352.1 conserved hypothetical protein [Vibrio parahaemolyticus AQ4037]EJG0940202.1 hypothetical protein [Vibrio parahaemolyticus O1]EJG0950563.1 hypothetical protein [Vibrio parahaemolyticus O1:K58]EVU13854.1 hypothetical protein D046_5592 [Vibrio parahaemolyticus V-223/04]ALG54341.1 hypothetical protein FORC6_4015 [Vibrio parahaemolyticus]